MMMEQCATFGTEAHSFDSHKSKIDQAVDSPAQETTQENRNDDPMESTSSETETKADHAKPAVTLSAWGASRRASANAKKEAFGTATPSLSLIMAEQAEQENILVSINEQQKRKKEKEEEEKRRRQEQLFREQSQAQPDESEEELLQRVLKQSLEDSSYHSTSREIESSIAPAVASRPDVRMYREDSVRSLGSARSFGSSNVTPIPPSAAESPLSVPKISHMSALRENERTETLVMTPRSAEQDRQRRSVTFTGASMQTRPPLSSPAKAVASRTEMLESAKQHLSSRELSEIEQALQEADEFESSHSSIPVSNRTPMSPPINPMSQNKASAAISADEEATIKAALMEADMREQDESVLLALKMQQEEMDRQAAFELMDQDKYSAPLSTGAAQHQRQFQGNVRTMTRAQLDQESQRIGAVYSTAPPTRHPLDNSTQSERDADQVRATAAVRSQRLVNNGYDNEGEEFEDAGFRMNAPANGQRQWNRRDRHTIVGPNNEVRTKHDVQLQNQSNAQRLALEADEFGYRANVGNRAYNSFQSSMKKGTTKGVATHGTGRGGSDAEATKGKAMDPAVRLVISRAINDELITKLGGAVKQGKEAIVYHATSPTKPVAVKVFKRITEFRARADYVDGDPRYANRAYRNVGARDQLEMWAEKEFRNLVRANRARVPVPTALEYKANVLFMEFLGEEGWPAPQLREIELRHGSKKWSTLYSQVIESVRRLYISARLVHGDLSEFNILVAPASQVQNHSSSIEDVSTDLQTVIIDFGQAVDTRHPSAQSLLLRDLGCIRKFFTQKGVATMSVNESFSSLRRMKRTTTEAKPTTRLALIKLDLEASSRRGSRPKLNLRIIRTLCHPCQKRLR